MVARDDCPLELLLAPDLRVPFIPSAVGRSVISDTALYNRGIPNGKLLTCQPILFPLPPLFARQAILGQQNAQRLVPIVCHRPHFSFA